MIVTNLTTMFTCLAFLTACDRPDAKSNLPLHTEPPPKPMTQTDPNAWRNDPLLAERFLPDYPNDLQVIAHDGGPRITEASPELIWARVNGKAEEGRFTATVLNKPHGLKSVSEGTQIQFLIKRGWKHPVQARDLYLTERSDWIIQPCDKCGFDELFDPPSALIAKIFPNIPADATMDAFTSFCPICRGVQGVKHKNSTLKN